MLVSNSQKVKLQFSLLTSWRPGGGGLVAKSCPTLVTPWTAARQAPLFIGFPRQESWSGLPFPSPGDLPNPGIKPGSPALQAGSLPTDPPGEPRLDVMWLHLKAKPERIKFLLSILTMS